MTKSFMGNVRNYVWCHYWMYHDGAWLTGRAACELPMGFGQPGRRTGFTGHALRVVEAIRQLRLYIYVG